MAYIVKTIFLQNYFAPSAEMSELRRINSHTKDIISAMKRTEMASKTLEKELNAFAEKGLQVINVIQHPASSTAQYDLLVSVVLLDTN